MGPMYYIGLDVHKQKISYWVKDVGGKIYAEGWIPATRFDIYRWSKTLPQPWSPAQEATIFTGWIYDHLKPHAAELKVAHPLMRGAIAAAKNKTIASMPTRFATVCAAIFCRNATWLPPPSASGDELQEGCHHGAATQRGSSYDTCRRPVRSHAASPQPSIGSKCLASRSRKAQTSLVL